MLSGEMSFLPLIRTSNTLSGYLQSENVQWQKKSTTSVKDSDISQAITKITLQEILNNNHIEYEFYLKIL